MFSNVGLSSIIVKNLKLQAVCVLKMACFSQCASAAAVIEGDFHSRSVEDRAAYGAFGTGT